MQLAQGEQRVKLRPHSRYVCFCRNEWSHCEQLSVVLTPILSLALWPVHMELCFHGGANPSVFSHLQVLGV